ncbi:hypothetical protein R1sor_026265 [Riccia sorocarpa]|uniref:Uncharacterized protein n=1 Tax=Riccia sorocarpa TaxID=122646 RepID=A0ABD3GCM1_9MARC
MEIPPDVRARREKDALWKRKARYDQTGRSRGVEEARAREVLHDELEKLREEAARESSLLREQALEEARQIRNHAMAESEAIVHNALLVLGNGSVERRSEDMFERARNTAQEMVEQAHLETDALKEQAKTVVFEVNSSAADVVARARLVADEIGTQARQNAEKIIRDAWMKEGTIPNLAVDERTRREKDAARKRRKYWKQKEHMSQLLPNCEDSNSVRSLRTARRVARVKCQNKAYTGKWKLENVHPLKPSDVQAAYAEELGLGLGQAGDWREGSIADLVEVGNFFAVEAETPNEYNVDFWIMQCKKPLYQLEEDHTDDYGNIVYAEDFALKAIWYQQWGRRKTCFI